MQMPPRNSVLSHLALDQLAAWEEIAKTWLLVPAIREGSLHLVCPGCETSVYHVQRQSVSPDILLAATVAHLRNRHRELDPDA